MSRFRLPRLCSKIDVEELQVEMQRILLRQQFITTWDPETLLPPHTDVVLESFEGKQVYAHKAILVINLLHLIMNTFIIH
jgi:hypothetical protein